MTFCFLNSGNQKAQLGVSGYAEFIIYKQVYLINISTKKTNFEFENLKQTTTDGSDGSSSHRHSDHAI